MAQWSDPRANPIPRAATTSVGEAAFDRGLRSYMLSVYNTMASGVLLTGIVALLFASGGETRSEEHTSELQSLMRISYAVFCLKKKKQHNKYNQNHQTIYKIRTNQQNILIIMYLLY